MTTENRDDSEYDLGMPMKYVSKEELKKQFPDKASYNEGISIITLPKGTNSDGKNVWKGFKLPMGGFMVWSQDGKMALGKCDPITREVIEWNEM